MLPNMPVISVWETDISREMCLGAHIPRGNTYHCNNGFKKGGFCGTDFKLEVKIMCINQKALYIPVWSTWHRKYTVACDMGACDKVIHCECKLAKDALVDLIVTYDI